MSNGHYDVIIVGAGAGGGTLALELAPTGKRILLIERGDYLKRERDNWDPGAVFVEGKYQAKETWYGSDGEAFHPGLHYFVGGNTKVYGGALFRLRREDFGVLPLADGISPAWPVGYDEYEPYYTRAEQLFPRPARPIRMPRCRTNRASSSWSTASSAPGTGPFPSRSRSCLTKPTDGFRRPAPACGATRSMASPA